MTMNTRIASHFVSVTALLGAALVAPAVPVTFQVNMFFQSSIGNFDPVHGTVKVHGSFNGWGAGTVLTNSPASPDVYRGAVEVSAAAGSRIAYKFVYNNNAGGGDQWEANGPYAVSDRLFRLDSAAQTLPLAYYNDIWDGAPLPLTFQVDMSVQTAAGNFNPATQTVEARGKFNGWAGGFTLTNSPANAGIYSGTVELAAAPGATVEYKFVIAPNG